LAGEAVLFRAEDEGDAAAAGPLLLNERRQGGEGDDLLLGLAEGEGSGADDQRAGGDCFGEGRRYGCVLEEVFGADGRAGFAPVGFEGRDHCEAIETEVGHGARGRPYIEGIARGDEDDVELGCGGQETIVVRRRRGAKRPRVATLQLRMLPYTDSLSLAAESLCSTARWCYTRGWVPATSGNFSVRDREAGRILITTSGLDKGTLTPDDLLEVDLEGRVLRGEGRPSAETALHLVLYRARAETAAILHVHTVWNTLLSGIHADAGHVAVGGYELLKGLAGVSTHDYVERVPILKNSQDFAELTARLADALKDFPEAHGVLLSRHGLYTWGESVAEARRHLEALEFLFEVEGRRALGGRA